MWKRNSVKEAEKTTGEDEWRDSFSCDDSTQNSDSSGPDFCISNNEAIDETEEQWIERLRQVGIPVERREFESKFEEIGTLGKGAYGSVSMVKERATARTFAIKRVDVPLNPSWLRKSGDKFEPSSPPDSTPSSSVTTLTPSLIHVSSSTASASSFTTHSTEARDPIFEKLTPRLLREVHAMASLGHHQHLVKFYNSWLEIKAVIPKEAKKSTSSCDTEDSSFSDSESFYQGSHTVDSVKNEHSINSRDTTSFVATESNVSISMDNSAAVSEPSDSSSTTVSDSTSYSKESFNWNIGRQQLVKSGNQFFSKSPRLPRTHCLTLFIQMELCSSDSLHSWLRSPERASVDRKLSIRLFSQLLSALTHIHENGFFHRDIKPDNLLIVYDGIRREPSLKLADFGLSKTLPATRHDNSLASSTSSDCEKVEEGNDDGDVALEEKIECQIREVSVEPSELSSMALELIRHTQGRGTAMYMAPEVWRGRRYDEKVDVYAAGIVLFELFHRFDTGSERIQALTRLKERREVDECFERDHPDVARLVLAMTHPDPSMRPRAIDILTHPAFTAFEFVDSGRIIIESDGESESESEE